MSGLPLPESKLIEFSKAVDVIATRFLEGFHSSQASGGGVEFHSALPYTEGEEARTIDWKKYAATDRYYVNRFHREQKASWRVWIDGSPSMKYGGKADWSRLWAACLIFLAKLWGDRWILGEDRTPSLEEAFQNLISGSAEIQDFFHIPDDLQKEDRLIVLSDFFWESRQLTSQLRRWKNGVHSLHLVQVLDPKEIDFPFEGVVEFKDLESSDKLVLDSRSVKRRYQVVFQELQQALLKATLEQGSFLPVRAGGEKLENQLLSFFESL